MGRKGSVLLLAIFLMVILFYVGVTFHRLLPTERHAANQLLKDTQVAYSADAGLRHTVLEVESLLEKGRSPKRGSAEGELGGFLWESELQPLRNGRYRVSTVVTDRQLSPALELEVLLQERLYCSYAWFQDSLLPQKSFPTQGFRIEGPVHFNSALRIRGVRPGIWRGGTAPFAAGVTVAETTSDDFPGDGVRYLDGSEAGWVTVEQRPYDSDGNPLPERYQRLFEGGRGDLRTGSRRIPMVDFREALRNRAVSALARSEKGELVELESHEGRLEGGVLVHQDLDRLDLVSSLAASRTARLRFDQSGRTVWYLVTEALYGPVTLQDGRVLSQGQTSVERFQGRPLTPEETPLSLFADPLQPACREAAQVERQETTILQGLTNGVIYCQGNIGTDSGGGLRGVNRGPRTIAASGTIFFAGDLLPAELAGLGLPTVSGGDSLGVLARTLKVNLPARGGPRRVSTDPLYLYGSYYAGGVPDGPDPAGLVIESPYSGHRGILQVVGSIQLAASNGGQEDSGMALEVTFDPQILAQPPPYYPRLPRLEILKWKESWP